MTNKINGIDWKNRLEDAILSEAASDAETITGTATDLFVTPAGLQAKVASATEKGIVELATSAETITGTDAERAITPAGLQAKVASATAKGIAELATGPETLAVTDQARVVTPYGLGSALAALDIISFSGKNGAGACTATGVKAGDVIFGLTGQVAADVGNQSALFEATITVNDQIQQSSALDLSTKVYMALIYRLT